MTVKTEICFLALTLVIAAIIIPMQIRPLWHHEQSFGDRGLVLMITKTIWVDAVIYEKEYGVIPDIDIGSLKPELQRKYEAIGLGRDWKWLNQVSPLTDWSIKVDRKSVGKRLSELKDKELLILATNGNRSIRMFVDGTTMKDF